MERSDRDERFVGADRRVDDLEVAVILEPVAGEEKK